MDLYVILLNYLSNVKNIKKLPKIILELNPKNRCIFLVAVYFLKKIQ